MSNYTYMQASFEKEKNLKAGGITLLICLLLFLFFFFVQWTLPIVPAPDFGEGIEVNLGNSETGLGDIAPQTPGEPSPSQEEISTPPPTANTSTQQPITSTEDNDPEDPAVNTNTKKAENKPVVKPDDNNIKKSSTSTVNPTPAPAKPKAVFKGGTSTTSSGNNADSYNNTRDQGIAGGKGDQGKPNGNPLSDSYKGNGGTGTAGVSIRSGLDGRRLTKIPSFEDDFNENAKVAVDITVNAEGGVIAATINPRGTTTTNQSIRAIALRKARQLKLNAASEEQNGTIVFDFKIK